MQIITQSSQETQALAAALAPYLQAGMVLRLEGNLGAGKTTFTQGLGRALGIQRAIKSPTYTIVKEYSLDQMTLVHIDAYRLEAGGQEDMDWDYYLAADKVVLIEWAQFMEPALPNDYLWIDFSGQGDQDRLIQIHSQQEAGIYTDLLDKWLKNFFRRT